eukprot:6170415-Pleurochrysis_carterae.AAC.1
MSCDRSGLNSVAPTLLETLRFARSPPRHLPSTSMLLLIRFRDIADSSARLPATTCPSYRTPSRCPSVALIALLRHPSISSPNLSRCTHQTHTVDEFAGRLISPKR